MTLTTTLCGALLAQAAWASAEGGTPSLFREDPGLLIWTAVVFFLVLGVLRWKVWGPITQGLQQREDVIRQALDSAEKLHHDAQELLARYQKLTDEARGEAQAIINEGKADAQRLGAKLLAEAQREVEAQQERALAEIDQAKNTALAELQKATVDLSLRIASKLIERELNGEDHERLAANCVNEYARAAETIHA